jgi:hypothetical protein
MLHLQGNNNQSDTKEGQGSMKKSHNNCKKQPRTVDDRGTENLDVISEKHEQSHEESKVLKLRNKGTVRMKPNKGMKTRLRSYRKGKVKSSSIQKPCHGLFQMRVRKHFLKFGNASICCNLLEKKL